MFRNQVNKSFIVDDINAFDQRGVTQTPARNIGAKNVKRQVIHPAGNLLGMLGFCHGRINAVFYQQN